jgi:phosphoribosylaminoimidazolecarboxamide formyltransferase/IMP cyclohydrolase
VASGADKASIIEKIDIGGISLIRAAAKNYKDVLVVSGRHQYESLFDLLNEKDGETNLDDRMHYAAEAFNVSSHYDTQIFNYFNTEVQIPAYKISEIQGRELRYGENPHQKGLFFGDFDALFDKIHGKEISYNNLLDIDAAVQLISEFSDTTFAVLKHNNACGLASRPELLDAWKDALAGDPISAFGGILITNSKLNHETAVEINKLFFEAIIAPAYDEDALEVLKQKKNRIILIQKEVKLAVKLHRSVLNGTLVQDKDIKTETVKDMKTVTKKTPSDNESADMAFANIVVKHSKSNSIVLARNNQLLASGVGQTSRIDALKPKGFGFDLSGAVMASDAFFPFADSVEIAGKAGITAVIQPGGSVRDQESIDYCNDHNIAMVFTGTRHFKH